MAIGLVYLTNFRPCEVHSLVIFGTDVAEFDFGVLNLLELLDFLNILGIQLPQVPLC